MITLGDKQFKYKKDIKQFVSDNIENWAHGKIDKNHYDFQFMYKLFYRHPELERKLYGSDIEYFHVVSIRNKQLAYKCLNGSRDTFSWKCCISQKSPSHLEMVKKAMRNSVDFQIAEYRNINNTICVDCSNNLLFCDVDHKKPFIELFNDFFEEYEVDIPDLKISTKRNLDEIKTTKFDLDDEYTKSFYDEWTEYHYVNAILQYLCKECHKGKTNKDNYNSGIKESELPMMDHDHMMWCEEFGINPQIF